jgi:Mrp family chromosome partitioning ATPase
MRVLLTSAPAAKINLRGEPQLNTALSTDQEPNLAFQGILHSALHRLQMGEGIVIAFTSANPGEGVSYVSRKIASQLSSGAAGSTLYTSLTELQGESWLGGPNSFEQRTQFGSMTTWEDWRSRISGLRARYRYTIIDCPAVSTSGDVLSLAPHLDGVVVVVAANETRKAQVGNLERQIQMVNGKILGYLLNKRKYMVPDWLYKRL